MKSIIKLGTRRSLLASAQSHWVAEQMEKFHPGLCVELVGIETRGDKMQHISLQKVEGKEFFVAELDEALISGKVDFTVHSMKDLSLNRPTEIICAAIPKRENPRDVILYGPHTMRKLMEGKSLKIGSSSPRRQQNIPSFLQRALPKLSEPKSPRLEWLEVRGNVNTRLSRLHEDPSSDKSLDGVVLALAGLIRLWADSQGRAELEKLLHQIRWMILPVSVCPAAPAQGALAVECRKKDVELQAQLSFLHSADTAALVAQERAILAEWGGGCHQALGATAYQHCELGSMLFIRGMKPNGVWVEKMSWQSPPNIDLERLLDQDCWDGSVWRVRAQEQSQEQSIEQLDSIEIESQKSFFVTHSRAWPQKGITFKNSGTHPILNPELFCNHNNRARIWTSGIASWFALAAKGVWVEGCAEGFGFKDVMETLQSPVLQLPPLKHWIALTHSRGLQEWAEVGIEAIPTYQFNVQYRDDAIVALRNAKFVFWSSGSQFDALKIYVSNSVQQSCGPGKTADHIRKAGFKPLIFPSVKEWRQWIKV